MIACLDVVQEYQLDILVRLNKASSPNSKITYITLGPNEAFYGDIQNINKFKEELKSDISIRIDSTSNLIFKNKINELINIPFSIDENFILSHKKIETLFYRITDRNCIEPIPVFQRRQLYLILLNYANFIITDLGIKTLLVFDTSHTMFSVIFYELAKHYKIQINRFEGHFLDKYSLHLTTYNIPNIPQNYLANWGKDQLQEKIPKAISDNLFGYNAYYRAYKKRALNNIVRKDSPVAIKLILKYIFKYITNLIIGVFPSLVTQRVRHFTSLNNQGNSLYYRKSLNRQLWKLIKLHYYYIKVSQEPDLTKK